MDRVHPSPGDQPMPPVSLPALQSVKRVASEKASSHSSSRSGVGRVLLGRSSYAQMLWPPSGLRVSAKWTEWGLLPLGEVGGDVEQEVRWRQELIQPLDRRPPAGKLVPQSFGANPGAHEVARNRRDGRGLVTRIGRGEEGVPGAIGWPEGAVDCCWSALEREG